MLALHIVFYANVIHCIVQARLEATHFFSCKNRGILYAFRKVNKPKNFSLLRPITVLLLQRVAAPATSTTSPGRLPRRPPAIHPCRRPRPS
jgi:hypothetical protein